MLYHLDMIIEINWVAVVLANVIGLIAAGTWYQKPTFGPLWRKLTGITPKDSQKAGKTPMMTVVVANFITSIVLTGMISISSTFFADTSVSHALFIGFVTWLAFSATTLATHNAFELKPLRLTWINNGYQLVLFLSMALAIGLVGA